MPRDKLPLPSLRIHQREQLVRDAELKLMEAIHFATEKLTTAESLRVVNAACSDWIATTAKYAIRMERHGNADSPGGLEKG